MLRLTGRVGLVATILEVVLGNVLGDVWVVLELGDEGRKIPSSEGILVSKVSR